MPASKKPTRIKLCQENRGLCTSDCSYRPSCQKHRIPFLIPAIVINYRTGKIYGDEYINELAKLKQDRLDLVCHRGGSDLKQEFRTNLKINSI